MKMERFDGVGVALVTPFDDSLAVDELSLRRLVEHVIEGGVDFLVVLGTTGECATLSAEEKAQVVNVVLGVNRGRLPIMVGMGGNNSAEVVREIRHSEWLKDCQGILSITPFYNKPSQAGLFEHFKSIAAATSLPLCLYNVPSRTGVNMDPETIMRLTQECNNIQAIKEASGNFEQATSILRQRRPDLVLFSGDDSIVMPLMAMGFNGVISVAANLFPRKYTTLVRNMKMGQWDEARKLHLELSELCHLLFKEGNPAGIKAALHAAGIISQNKLRLPLTPVSEGLFRQLSDCV
jgi:4-hydroxy-tetrahydrodipicolinate synthase